MAAITRFFLSEKAERWFTWITRAVTLVLIPAAVWCMTYLKTSLLAHGNIHFVSREEFMPVKNSVVELTSQTNVTISSLMVIRSDLAHIQESLKEIKTDIREVRSRK